MGVLRDGSDNLSLRLSYIIRPMWLRTVTNRPVRHLVCVYTAHLYLSVIHRPRHLTSLAVLGVFFFINIILIITLYMI
jgi:hypothetical protein